MPYRNFKQPEIIEIDTNLRLRAYDGNYQVAVPWYQNEVVYYNSEGITDKNKIPDEEYVKGMYEYFQKIDSEMYFIEVMKDGKFIPIGDAAMKEENPPIVIGVDEYRGIGIGKKVMTAIINRAREVGITRITETTIYEYNIASQKLYESLGFKRVGVRGQEYIYELLLFVADMP